MIFLGAQVVDSYTGLLWCGRGLHLLDDTNTYVSPQGLRYCRPCNALRRRELRRRAKRSVVRAQRLIGPPEASAPESDPAAVR